MGVLCSPVRAPGSPLVVGFKALWMQHLGLWISDVLGSAGGMVGLHELHDLGELSQPKRFCDSMIYFLAL